jgi:transposase-like protein
MGLLELTKRFSSQEKCKRYIQKVRWPDGVTCPKCSSGDPYHLRSVKKFECSKCGYQFSVTSGTIFHKTYVPLPKWFLAIYLIIASKQNATVNQIHAALDLPYKTAWYMHERISQALKNGELKEFCSRISIGR